MLLQQRRGAGLQLDHIAVVGFVLGAVETLDVGMGDLNDHHAFPVAQRIQLIEIFAPDGQSLGITLAKARGFDRLPAIAFACLSPDQRLEPIDAVNDDRAVVMIFLQQGVERLCNFGITRRQREMRGLQFAQAILGHKEDRPVGIGREGGFAHPGHTVDQDARWLKHRCCAQ